MSTKRPNPHGSKQAGKAATVYRLQDQRAESPPDSLDRASIIELRPEDEIVPPVLPTVAAFADFIERGDTRAIEHAYTARRLRELTMEPPRPVGLLEVLFGAPRGANGVTRDVLRGIREIREEALRNTQAQNALNRERIRLGNTQIEFEHERSRVERYISKEELGKTENQVRIREVSDDAEVRSAQRTVQLARHRREHIEQEIAAEDLLSGREDREDELRAKAEAAQAWAKNLEDGIRRRDEEIKRMRRESDRREQAERSGVRSRQEEVERARHKARLAELEAEKAGHEAAAKKMKGPLLTPEEESFERTLSEERQKHERVARLEAELARVGATHGIASELYRQTAATLDELKMKILGGES